MMIVRKAGLEDLQRMTELFDGYRRFYKQTDDLRGAEKFLRQRMKANESVIFVAEQDTKLLGFTQLFPSFSSVSMQRLWILNDLFVAQEARKQGVAEMLMNAAKRFAEETNSKGIILETDVDNIQAQSLYHKLGYSKQNSTYHYFLSVAK